MTEGAMTAVERDGLNPGGAMVAFTDLFILEVIDLNTGKPVPEGHEGSLIMTPIWSNTITPFLRRQTGDIVTMRSQERGADPFSVFPVLEHALRTEGFFKIRGVNINHGDLEDFMFEQPDVRDFRAELISRGELEYLRLLVEVPRGVEPATVVRALIDRVKAKFELTPYVEVLQTGVLATEQESSIKAPRFLDKRE